MKIIYFGSDYTPTGGGISTYTKDWLDHISDHQELSWGKALIFGNKLPRVEVLSDRFKVHTFKDKSLFAVALKIFKTIISKKADVFHALNLFPVGFLTVFSAKLFGKKSAVTFYGTDACATNSRLITKKLKAWTLSNADYAFTISEFTKVRSAKMLGVEANKFQVIYPFVPILQKSGQIDLEKISETVTKSAGLDVLPKFTVLSVCRLVKRKGLEYLIQAMALVKNKDVVLLMVGDGPERESLENLTKKLGCENTVKFVGKAPDLDPFYRVAKVCTLVSYFIEAEGDFEGLGLVLLEAQSYKVPVIGSQSGGIPEAFKDGGTGILVPERNAEAIAEAITKLASDHELWQKLSDSTTDFLSDRFDSRKIVLQYFSILKNNSES